CRRGSRRGRRSGLVSSGALGCHRFRRSLGVGLKVVNLPIRLLELLWLGCHEVNATGQTVSLGQGARISLAKDAAGPIAAEGRIEHNLLRLELLTNIAGALEVAHRSTELGHIRRAAF